MAEGLCRALRGDLVEAYSAGTETHGLNPRAVRAMQEIGIDISGHTSKTTQQLDGTAFDYVVTVCGHAGENCPWFPAGTRLLHRGFDDPPRLTAGMTDEEAIMRVYRRVRDEIRDFILEIPKALEE
jgi:arsenate reductase (thioredoxin)